MQTTELPPTDPPRGERTYTQTEAARACGITQRSLIDRDGNKTGYLTKLHQCFPGQYFSRVAVGSLNSSNLRLTKKGVEELQDLLQSLSPEPAVLVDRKPTYDSEGKVIKRKQRPEITLREYAEYCWFREAFDGAAELEALARIKKTPTIETVQAAAIAEDEEHSTSVLVSINNTTDLAEYSIDSIEQINESFWAEAARRATAGYQQGHFLKSIEIEARTRAEVELEKDYIQRSRKVASRKPKA